MFRRIKRSDLVKGKQAGIASIVVVSVLVVVMSLVAIGFSKLMNRSLQQSTTSSISLAANYAARSAVNDAIAYAKQNPTQAVTDCNTLIGSGQLKDAAKLSEDTKYTCLLINPNPEDLVYQKLPPLQSQVIKLTTCTGSNPCNPTSAGGGSFMFSWESYDRTFDQLPGGQTFYNEKKWSLDKYEPVLRVSLYPIGTGGSLDSARTGSKTYFFYPNPKTNDTVNTVAYGSEGLQKIECGKDRSKISTGSFKGSADYNCNVIINGLAAADYYYARITPIYNQTNVKIKANDSSNNVLKFSGVQSVIDATAKSGNAVKRLEARIDSSGISSGRDYNLSPDENAIPEFALRSSNQICKRLIAPTDINQPVFIDINSQGICELSLQTSTSLLSGPTVDLKANNADSLALTSVQGAAGATLSWTTTNSPDTCSASGDWNGSKDKNGGSEPTGSLTSSRTYTYNILCRKGSSTATDSVEIAVAAAGQPAACPSGTTGTPPNCSAPTSSGGGGNTGGGNTGGTGGGDGTSGSSGSRPVCWIDNHNPPVGWGCTNSHSLTQDLNKIDAGNGCYYYYISDWNYSGKGSASTDIFCPTGGTPTGYGTVPDPVSSCPAGQLGDPPNNCIDINVYYQSLTACQPPYVGNPQPSPGVWYGNPVNWGSVPGCSLPQTSTQPQPNVPPPPFDYCNIFLCGSPPPPPPPPPPPAFVPIPGFDDGCALQRYPLNNFGVMFYFGRWIC